MPKTMRESHLLKQVRRWRAEAYDSVWRQPPAVRLQRTREWAARLDLPMAREESAGSGDANTGSAEATLDP